MKRLTLLLSSFALTGLLGCQRDDSAVKEKLDQIDKRLGGIEDAIKAGGGRGGAPGAGQQGPQRPRPNPTDVYSIDVGSAPIEGNVAAKVTIIEAFEFA